MNVCFYKTMLSRIRLNIDLNKRDKLYYKWLLLYLRYTFIEILASAAIYGIS